jgi:hypothetical protein
MRLQSRLDPRVSGPTVGIPGLSRSGAANGVVGSEGLGSERIVRQPEVIRFIRHAARWRRLFPRRRQFAIPVGSESPAYARRACAAA